MKKALLSRFDPVLQIIADVLADPSDFQKLTMTFGHGSRQLPGSVEADDAAASLFRYKLPGRSGTAPADEMAGLIRECCVLYDSCRFELHQRGQNRFFEAGDRGVRMGSLAPAAHMDDSGGIRQLKVADDGHFSGVSATRDYRVRINEAPELLQAIGVLDQQGRLRNDKIRKYNQIDRFVELAEPILSELAAGQDSLNVFDLACGKSYLAFVLNYFIRDKMQLPCHITGVDLSDGVIASSRQLAARLSYRNMTFQSADLRHFRPSGPVDLCISLHACDAATDFALAAAIGAQSRAIIVVPCCQRELLASDYSLPAPLGGLLEHGVLKTRMADLLTDHLRLLLLRAAGYETSLIEYISPLDTPKNLMIRARRTGRPDPRAVAEYRELTHVLGCTITLGKILEETDYGRHTGNWQR